MTAVATAGIRGAFDRAYVINLAAATERWANVSAEFAKIGVTPVRFEAVNGKAMTRAERAAAATPACASCCTPSTIACACSHVGVWERVLEDGVTAALSAEDDVVFDDNFRSRLEAVAAEFPPDFDVIYLGCQACTGQERATTKAVLQLVGLRHPAHDVSPHIWVPPSAFGTHCYIVSAAGARKLLAAVKGRINTHIDKMMNALMGSGAINAYAVRPLLATQTVSLAVTSIATSKTPRGPNALLDGVTAEEGVTMGYVMNSPFGRVGAYNVTLWTATFFGSGAVLGAAKAPVAVALALCMLLLLLDMAPLLRGDRDTAVNVATSVAVAVAGWLAGYGIRVGVGALVKGPRQRTDFK